VREKLREGEVTTDELRYAYDKRNPVRNIIKDERLNTQDVSPHVA
jgi:hypothetical protein